MGRVAIGELEHLILVAVLRLEDAAYGAAIVEEIEARTGRDISQAAAYISLQRMERKGMIEGRTEDDGDPARGGRPRRYFRLTETGMERLERSAQALFAMWGEDGLRRKVLG